MSATSRFEDAAESALWCQVAVAVAASSNSNKDGSPGRWADRAVPDFRRRAKALKHDESALWRNMAVAVAASSNSIDLGSMAKWADRAVVDYRERLPLRLR